MEDKAERTLRSLHHIAFALEPINHVIRAAVRREEVVLEQGFRLSLLPHRTRGVETMLNRKLLSLAI